MKTLALGLIAVATGAATFVLEPVAAAPQGGGQPALCEFVPSAVENSCATEGCDVDYDLWWSGYSVSNCGGCKVDWTYEVSKNGSPHGLGNGHDSISCSSQTSHSIRCPCNTSAIWVTFTFTCNACPQ